MKTPIRFGVIGVGLWGEVHAEIYAQHPYAILAGVCDRDCGRAEEVAERYGAERVYGDYRELAADPGIDAVAVVTPDFAHREPIVAAAEAGKHVITEKPLATTREDADAVAEAVRKAGITFMVDFHARWNPPLAIARQDISEGKLGRIVSGYFRLNDTISVPTEMLSWAEKSSILWFLGSHTVDSLRFLFQEEVKRVYSVSRSSVLKSRGVDVPDLYQSILEFDSGIVATIENSWILPNTHPSVNDIKVNILGSKGMINMDLTNNQMIERYLADHSDHPDCLVKPRVRDRHVGFAYESIRDFVDCLYLGKRVQASLDDGLKVTQVVLAIMESASSGVPVEVNYGPA
ncbi:MAG: Gfo/Idh/MocA family oxidoreductase [Spirochaetales bacterium]|nr:Gfo/Idh/MocA family oxidoreductase [Spirochaetales bacterium]